VDSSKPLFERRMKKPQKNSSLIQNFERYCPISPHHPAVEQAPVASALRCQGVRFFRLSDSTRNDGCERKQCIKKKSLLFTCWPAVDMAHCIAVLPRIYVHGFLYTSRVIFRGFRKSTISRCWCGFRNFLRWRRPSKGRSRSRNGCGGGRLN
jgi:hypothetical protein